MTFIDLGVPEQAFARGGNRLCYVDPNCLSRCIKVLRPDRSPRIRRSEKSFPKNLKSLNQFDDNREEYSVVQKIEKSIGTAAYQLIPEFYGYVDTNLGPGLVCELIRDSDGLISISLKQYIWQYGVDEKLQLALDRFSNLWSSLGMPSRNLLLHNIVVQRDNDAIVRLVVIDGLGWPGLFPLAYFIPFLARRRAARKVKTLFQAIENLLDKQINKRDYGVHGWITDDKRKTI